ncbi:hypothetical protein GLOIN_2v1870331 [Rhizophagus irregularis DAOM 181602=DAOM 197198]|uniref:Uncharacterized protein n=1 Tax=Rhizophagus irregularis (strain DAOM 181602 / DAOM 197198 / MUCL 43194) TaxID=747089 RepID=A0A2P4QMD0_RHIID|nr:hypothetical protein GLOIN_2v1870331 [Rhizophagus irregularis DAOM 181602=DAOM 197198]POG78765.1 hypothetical protein GLOIN_2v1870331 [Rhizophagus irregularis DAOM 181602=DAOM 197198]|eukprot:XP_025185631.1 hypothetical protein GLOIN_2v1870331 [Rhizophagus irregularis DAOM 181602=DAOM 197198]
MSNGNFSLSGVLPTYSVLNKRGVNGIINPRCKTVSEDWDHEDLIKRSICEYEQKLLEENRNEEVNILKEIMFDFIRILEQPSLVLIGKKREWELLRGVKDIRKGCEVVADIEKEQGLEKELEKEKY